MTFTLGQVLAIIGILGSILSVGATALIFVIRLEGKVNALQNQHGGFTTWLERVEEKLDRMIERWATMPRNSAAGQPRLAGRGRSATK